MKKISVNRIAEMIGAELIAGSGDREITGVSTDSREVKASDIFFPLIGENHDAHAFLGEVFQSGCRAAVVSDREVALKAAADCDVSLLLTGNTLHALQQLAKAYIAQLPIKKLAVTGSVGKTGTRDILHAAMSTRYKTIKPAKNFNNEIGVPITAFQIEDDTEAAIFEMGMERHGEIHLLADIVRPETAIITNVGSSHIETVGSREGILQAKLEVTDFFTADDCLIIYDGGDILTKESAKGEYKLITVGKDGSGDFIVSDVCNLGEKGVQFTIEHNCKAHRIKLPVPGEHNVYNAALAIAAAYRYGIGLEEAAAGVATMKITDKRLSIKENHGIKVLDDTYNASPESMKAGIAALLSVEGLRKVAILGDMFGLGDESERYHREVGSFIGESRLDLLITVGNYAKYIKEAALPQMQGRAFYFETKDEFLKEMDVIVQKGDVILVKGSRGMKMEHIVNKILE